MEEQRTLVLVKPDGVERALTGRIVRRLRDAGLRVEWMKLCRLSYAAACDLYSDHSDKEHFPELVAHMMGDRGVTALMVTGPDAVSRSRLVALQIREDLATSVRCNVVHASATVDDARRELGLMFGET